MKCLLCPYAVSAEDSPASLCSEQGGDQLHSCLGANIVPAAVAIGKKPKAELSKFRVPEKNMFKSAGIESGRKFLSRSDAQWVPSTTSFSCVLVQLLLCSPCDLSLSK